MKKSIKLALRASEIRSDINKLDPGESTIEKRREMLGQLDTVETEYRAALTEEAEAESTAPDANGLTPEQREFRQLEGRAEMRNAFRAVMDGKPLAGAEKELQEHRGLGGNDIPWEMVAPRRTERTEDRADAVSAAPADSHLQQHGIIGRVFARSATATLGVQMPGVPTGQQNFPTVTTTDTASILAKDAAEDYDPAIVPAGASVVIGAVDVQDNRLEAELSAWGVVEVAKAEDASNVRGWGSHEFRGLQHEGRWFRLRRWALDYRRFHGDPGNPDLWQELADWIETPLPHSTGCLLRPVTVGIDSGGHYGPQVAEFVKASGPGYQCIKGLGRHRHDGYIGRRSVTADVLDTYGPNGLLLVGTNEAKASIFSLLRQSIAGAEPRPMVWPADESRYSMLEFEGIVSETLVRVLDKRTGATTLTWRKIGRSNEALDLLVYSLAVVSHLGVGFVLSEGAAIRKAIPCAA